MFRKLTMFTILALPQMSIAAGTLGIADLPTSPAHNNPVCYNESNGVLGNCTAGAMKLLENLVWVAKNGTGEYDDPIQAINDIDSWCPDRSGANRCVIRIAPGVWDLGSTPLVLQSKVHIQGSGGTSVSESGGNIIVFKAATILKGAVSGQDTGVVIGTQHSSIRDLGVINESTGTFGVAIYHNHSEFFIKGVYAKAVGSTNAYGLITDSTASYGAYVTAESSTFVGEGTTKSRGIYIANYTDSPANVKLRNCDAHTKGSGTDQLGILMEAYPPGNKNWTTGATIRHSRIQEPVKTRGDGRVYLSVEHSNIKSIENLGTGTNFVKCAFVTSGVYADGPYTIHTDTCP